MGEGVVLVWSTGALIVWAAAAVSTALAFWWMARKMARLESAVDRVNMRLDSMLDSIKESSAQQKVMAFDLDRIGKRLERIEESLIFPAVGVPRSLHVDQPGDDVRQWSGG